MSYNMSVCVFIIHFVFKKQKWIMNFKQRKQPNIAACLCLVLRCVDENMFWDM